MAVAVDPNFAMAYRALGAAYSGYGNVTKQREYTQKALELIDRVSVREKFNIQALYYTRSEKTLDKAIEAYEKLLEFYPDDMIGNGNLPTLYSNIGKNEKAVELSEKAMQYFPHNVVIYCNLAYFYFTLGSYRKAKDILRDYEKNVSANNSSIKHFLAMSLFLQNEYSQALTEIESSIAFDPSKQTSTMTKGDIHLFQGDFFQAEREYTKLLKIKAFEQIGYARLGALYLLLGQIEDSITQVEKGLELQKIQGRNFFAPDFYLQLAYRHLRAGEYEKALEQCNGALDYAIEMEKPEWQLWALYFKGLTYIGKKSIDEAQTTAEELLEIAKASFNVKDIRWHYHLLGLIDLEKGDFSRTVEHFEKSLALTNYEGHWSDDLHALFIEPMAEAHYRSGDLDKSRQEYEKILSLTRGRLSYGDIYAESFYRLGKIAEQQGEKRRALEHYKKFFDLWKDADLEFPEAQDVKDRLDDLKIQ